MVPATCSRRILIGAQDNEDAETPFRLSWLRKDMRQPPVYPQSTIDPDEFTRLLCSRRVEDLRILAKKLSRQPTAHV
jgi:hypothetical protein